MRLKRLRQQHGRFAACHPIFVRLDDLRASYASPGTQIQESRTDRSLRQIHSFSERTRENFQRMARTTPLSHGYGEGLGLNCEFLSRRRGVWYDLPPEAIGAVVVYYPGSLHPRIDDYGPHEFESPFL